MKNDAFEQVGIEYRAQVKALVDKTVADIARKMLREMTARLMQQSEIRKILEARDPFFPRSHDE